MSGFLSVCLFVCPSVRFLSPHFEGTGSSRFDSSRVLDINRKYSWVVMKTFYSKQWRKKLFDRRSGRLGGEFRAKDGYVISPFFVPPQDPPPAPPKTRHQHDPHPLTHSPRPSLSSSLSHVHSPPSAHPQPPPSAPHSATSLAHPQRPPPPDPSSAPPPATLQSRHQPLLSSSSAPSPNPPSTTRGDSSEGG